MTRDEFNKLPSNGHVRCPDCGLKNTEPCGGCGCPSGLYTTHINKYHHNCERALEHVYPTNKNNVGRGAVIEQAKSIDESIEGVVGGTVALLFLVAGLWFLVRSL